MSNASAKYAIEAESPGDYYNDDDINHRVTEPRCSRQEVKPDVLDVAGLVLGGVELGDRGQDVVWSPRVDLTDGHQCWRKTL